MKMVREAHHFHYLLLVEIGSLVLQRLHDLHPCGLSCGQDACEQCDYQPQGNRQDDTTHREGEGYRVEVSSYHGGKRITEGESRQQTQDRAGHAK